MKQQQAGVGSTAKHAGTSKTSSAAAGKHAPSKTPAAPASTAAGKQTAVAKAPAQAKAVGLVLGAAWPCCAAEAIGASLRLAGRRVTQDDILALHVAAGGTRDRGVPVLAALRAASVHGLAGVRPLSYRPFERRGNEGHDGIPELNRFMGEFVVDLERAGGLGASGHGLILGLELPGAHAVTVGSDGCWLSWGGHYDPAEWPDAVVEERWAVAW